MCTAGRLNLETNHKSSFVSNTSAFLFRLVHCSGPAGTASPNFPLTWPNVPDVSMRITGIVPQHNTNTRVNSSNRERCDAIVIGNSVEKCAAQRQCRIPTSYTPKILCVATDCFHARDITEARRTPSKISLLGLCALLSARICTGKRKDSLTGLFKGVSAKTP